MTRIRFKNFINLTDDEKLLVLEWRNSDRVRSKMANTEIIPKENHLKFIESLKTRNDCKYWLFMIDDVPVGVYDIVKINSNGIGEGGSYIGNVNYLGYGLLLCYLLTLRQSETIGFPKNRHEAKEFSFYVMKNNPRTYKMHTQVFGAKLLEEDDEKWVLYLDEEGWQDKKDYLKETLYDPLNIKEVVWEE